ncbi:MAG: glycosyltransferase [Candidatus Zixiibacteriota bacterium]|nr:MAG: glycosyltransferase [candidate division Zixibacteria bacterium]
MMAAKASRFDLAVIIPVRDAEKFLGQTLDQIYLQDFPMDRLELVIVDGGSTDGSRQVAESYKERFGSFKLLDNPRRLAPAGINIGVKNSVAPNIAILNAHTFIPSKNFLKDILDLFDSSGADCLCRPRPLTPPDINEFELAVAMCRGSALGHNPGSEAYSDFEGFVDPVASGAFYRRSVFEQVGLFDEAFDTCSDIDFNYRVKAAGLRSFISPRLKVFLYPRSTIQALWRHMRRMGVGSFKFTQKHGIFSPVQWLVGSAVLGFGLLLVLGLLSRPFYEVFKTLLAIYLLAILAFSLYLFLKEKRLACLLYGPVIFPTIHFGLGLGFLKAILEKVKPGSGQSQP